MTTTTRTPSFVDLLAWAAEGDAPAPGDFVTARRMLDLAEGPVSVGSIALRAGSGSTPPLDAHEFVIVLSGTVALVQDDRTVALGVGDSAVLPRGTAFDWSADSPATLVFMRYDGEAGQATAIVPIDAGSPLQPSGAPLAELLLGPTPQCRNHTAYTSPDGVFMCGTWDSTPYHRRAMTYGHYELMHLLEGAVTIAAEDGPAQTFRQGDIFLVERNARCSWESRVQVKKVYAIYRP